MLGPVEVIFVVVIIATIVFGRSILRALRWRGSVERSSCGRCGYCISGLLDLTCPECGGDLREVGIVTPRMRVSGPPGAWTRIAVWTGLLAVVASLISALILAVLPSYEHKSETWRFVSMVPGSSALLVVRMDSEGLVGRQPARKLFLSVDQAPRTIAPRLLVSDRLAGPAKSQAVIDALGAAAIDTTRPGVAAQAQEVALAAQQIWDTGVSSSFGASSSITHRTPWPPAVWAIVGIWLIIWTIGVVRVVRAAQRDARRVNWNARAALGTVADA